jgi:hypothetical protein
LAHQYRRVRSGLLFPPRGRFGQVFQRCVEAFFGIVRPGLFGRFNFFALNLGYWPLLPRTADYTPLPDDHGLVVVMNGDRLNIKASVDLDELRSLQEILKKYESISEMMQKMKADKKEAAD